VNAGILRAPRRLALIAVAALVAVMALASFAESYRGLLDWAREHDLYGTWAWIWPLQIDSFIAVGELALFVALVDAWSTRSRTGAWIVTGIGLAVSVAGNVGHVHGHSLGDRATAAVPPLAAAAALAVGLGVLKRVVEHHHQAAAQTPPGKVPSSNLEAAKAWYADTVRVDNPAAVTKVQGKFSLTRREATEICTHVIAPPPETALQNGSSHHE
jgi:hypothetical protein